MRIRLWLRLHRRRRFRSQESGNTSFFGFSAHSATFAALRETGSLKTHERSVAQFKFMQVIITGAGGGLGTAVAKAFVDSGAAVIGIEREWRSKMPFATVSADLSTAARCEAM